MTDLRRPIRRRTVNPIYMGNRIVVSLEPVDIITFREEKCRKTFSAPIGRLFTTVVMWNVDAAKAAKKHRGIR